MYGIFMRETQTVRCRLKYSTFSRDIEGTFTLLRWHLVILWTHLYAGDIHDAQSRNEAMAQESVYQYVVDVFWVLLL